MITLYHGTIEAHRKNIKENGIILDKGTPLCDFGQGFYATDDYNFALKTAEQRSFGLCAPLYKKSDLRPVVIVMSFDYDAAKKSSQIEVFDENNHWVEFIANNRNRNFNGIKNKTNNHNRDNKYDIVIGPTADKQISDVHKIFKKNIPNDFYKNFINPNYKTQYSFHTEKALEFLKIIKC